MVDLNEENFDEIAGEYQVGYRKKNIALALNLKQNRLTNDCKEEEHGSIYHAIDR